MKDEYISIAEFAKRAGVSHQAIYKRLQLDLQPWLQVEDGKKALNIKALTLFENEKSATGCATMQPVAQPVAGDDLLRKTVEILEEELKTKNRMITELQNENRELSRELLDLSGKVGNSLQALTQSQLAERMIEGKKTTENRPDLQNELEDHKILLLEKTQQYEAEKQRGDRLQSRCDDMDESIKALEQELLEERERKLTLKERIFGKKEK